MERLILTCVALLQLAFLKLGAGMFDCSRECFLPYQDYQTVDSCDTVSTVLDCYYSNEVACNDDFNAYFLIIQAMQDYEVLDCGDDNVTPTTPPAPLPMSTAPQPMDTTPQPTAQGTLQPTGAGMFDCSRECFLPYQDYQTVDSCDTVSTVLDCYSSNQVACDGDFDAIRQAMEDYQALGCASQPATSTTTTNSEPCPTLSDEIISSVSSMSSAVLFPGPHTPPPPECTMPRVSSLRQCSLFMDSQLRAFNTYRGGLETCSLPGSWYLFRHQKLTVEVEGTNFEMGSNHTRLTKVNVTFHTHECNPTTRTYTALNSTTLPSDFTPSQSRDSNNSLRLSFGEDGSVVTLTDTSLNATIVIRKYMEFLSVTLQVPQEVSLESEGLCTGCPSHLYINITTFNGLYPTLCPEENFRVLHSCFDYAGVANEAGLLHIQNNSYLDACVYSLFKIGRTLDVLTMFNAIADDAKLLFNVGEEPMPSQTVPTYPISTPLSLSPSSPADITQAATVTTNSASLSDASAAISFHNSRLLPLTLIALLHGILER